jgi:hypothetical protein
VSRPGTGERLSVLRTPSWPEEQTLAPRVTGDIRGLAAGLADASMCPVLEAITTGNS